MPKDDTPDWQSGLPFTLWRTQHAVHRRVQEAFEGMDVTITQLGLVVHLDDLGHMSASDLARRFRLTPQSVTTALGGLERAGWVRRLPHPVHRKVIWYELTADGVSRVAEARTRMSRVTAQIDDLIGADRRRELTERLSELATAIDGALPPPGPLWPAPRA